MTRRVGKRNQAPDEGFNRFWACYPKRVAKLDALKAWSQLKPPPELVGRILTALEWQIRQPSWLKDHGQFVPYPATWLRAGRWDDEPTVKLAAKSEASRPVVYAGWMQECFKQHNSECRNFEAHVARMKERKAS